MFSSFPLSENTKWNEPSVMFNLLIFCLMKFILIILALSCPIPAGVFGPQFVFGAVFGRFFGLMIKSFLPTYSSI